MQMKEPPDRLLLPLSEWVGEAINLTLGGRFEIVPRASFVGHPLKLPNERAGELNEDIALFEVSAKVAMQADDAASGAIGNALVPEGAAVFLEGVIGREWARLDRPVESAVETEHDADGTVFRTRLRLLRKIA